MILKNAPLYVPKGTVRAVLALSIVSAFIVGQVDRETALVVLAFYFTSRQAS